MLKLTHRDFEKFKSKGYLETTKDFLEKKYGLKFSKRGRQYFTYCPFHTENIPSFALYDKLEEVRLHYATIFYPFFSHFYSRIGLSFKLSNVLIFHLLFSLIPENKHLPHTYLCLNL